MLKTPQQIQKQLRKKSVWTSYSIGLPIGLLTIIILFSTPVMLTGEGLATMAFVAIYGKALLGLVIAFAFSLWLGAVIASKDTFDNESLLKVSTRYSLTINLIVWIVFSVITYLDNLDNNSIRVYVFLPILIAFIISNILTPFTLGLVISYRIRQQYRKLTNDN